MDVWLGDVSCASFAGIFGTITGHPFDTIKVNYIISNIKSVDYKQIQKNFHQHLKR